MDIPPEEQRGPDNLDFIDQLLGKLLSLPTPKEIDDPRLAPGAPRPTDRGQSMIFFGQLLDQLGQAEESLEALRTNQLADTGVQILAEIVRGRHVQRLEARIHHHGLTLALQALLAEVREIRKQLPGRE